MASPRASAQTVMFTRDIAPLVWSHCGECHRPGGAGPFSLITYNDVRQHARQIVDVTERAYMPPWIPDDDGTRFVGNRRMSASDRALLARWVEEGTPEGDDSLRPPVPQWPDRWRTGTPDLVLTLPEYVVAPTDGADVFRNFVIDVPIDSARFVRGFEFLPGSSVVHHANIFVDKTPASRELDAADPAPGYAGLIPYSAQFPDGHFLGWTPGQAAPLEPEGLAWTLRPQSSLLVQLHLKASGKPERIQPAIGLYFGRRPPTERAVALRLGRQNIDIAPGENRYRIQDSFVLPVDSIVHAVQAHSHYRAQTVRAQATKPDGARLALLTISRWDFNWQDVYRFETPLLLPKGTTLTLEYLLDNSAANPRNPWSPPRRAVWGFRSADEMADLWIQITTAAPADHDQLERAADAKMTAEAILGYETQIRVNPDYVPTRNDVGVLYMETGQPRNAVPHFTHVVRLQPQSPAAHFNLARALQMSGEVDQAVKEYSETLRLDSAYARAVDGLAESYYLQAFAHDQTGGFGAAADLLRRALALRPDWADAASQLTWVLATGAGFGRADRDEAIRIGERVREMTGGGNPSCLDSLAAAYAAAGRFEDAVATAESAIALAREHAPDLAAQIETRLRLYRSHTAVVRQPTPR